MSTGNLKVESVEAESDDSGDDWQDSMDSWVSFDAKESLEPVFEHLGESTS